MATLLRDLKIREISSVDKGAGEGVQIILMKSASAEADISPEASAYLKADIPAAQRAELVKSGAAMPDGTFPIRSAADLGLAIAALPRALDIAGVAKHIEKRATDLKLFIDGGGEPVAGFAKALGAVGAALASIPADASAADRQAAVTKSLADFQSHVSGLLAADLGGAIEAARKSAQSSKESSMLTPEQIAKLQKDAADGATALAQVAKLSAELAVAKLSPAEKSFADDEKMDEEAKKTFAAKSPAERESAMSKREIEKREDPVLKSIRAENADLKKRLDAADELRAIETFGKRATALGLPESEGETLRKAHGGDKAAVDKMIDLMGALKKQADAGVLFNSFGSRGAAQPGTETASLLAKRDAAVAADPTLSPAQAYAKAYKALSPEQREKVKAEERATAN